MSGPGLYRVMVRMLYDEAFTRAVYADRTVALAGLDLTPRERDWLVAPEPRAWRTDHMRRQRSLTGLLEEFPVAGAFVLRGGREGIVRLEMPRLDAFFSHPIFHACLQNGESMVFAFARFLEEPAHGGAVADPRVAPLARLEAAIARLRRVPAATLAQPSGDGPSSEAASTTTLRLAPWAVLLHLPAGTSELHARVSKALRAGDRQPLAQALNRQWSLPVLLELDPAVPEAVLVERPPEIGLAWAATGVRQAPITPELAGLLRAAQPGATRPELMAAARALGAEPGDDAEIVDGLIEEGLLAPARIAPHIR